MNPTLCILLTATTIASLSYNVDATTNITSIFVGKDIARDISYALTNMARDLSVHLQSNTSKTNIISPLSIGSSLLILLRTARGTTRLELLNLLHLNRYQRNDPKIPRNFGRLIRELLSDVQENTVLDDTPPWLGESKCGAIDYEYEDEDEDPYEVPPQDPNVVRLANAIFVQNGMLNNSRLEKVIKNLYQSTIENLNFFEAPDNATKHINNWANVSTNGRIPEIISHQLGRDTTMVVANALYFKAFWEEVFIDGATKPKKFFPDGENGESIEVQMMSNSGCFPYYFSQSLDAQIMGFPYKNRTTTMYVVLPKNSNRTKLQQLMAVLDAPTMDELISNMSMRSASVLFPKMHVSNSFDLKSALQALGVEAMFTRGRSDFSSLNPSAKQDSRNLRVSGVLHKVDLEVNEAGTEGGAVTVSLQDRIAPAVNFRVISPFLVAIRHDATKLLLFYGPIYDPTG
ncbi:serine protease inhibitor 28Dc-like [Topomyia yanbarensis]|uniref:serine protease inhibitor 28Dc-like n=1 Tax=Topomyia yanbarensis TaxID=2498891 RepID=UPI00273BA2E8|nr:serine protease inhibitor 28Dc-like [Topomyia yanbarensis]XP_058815816.1 serine protease inhibitor 28Dc-like [Topomyia yanbarensis]XP_058815817.1 serine protease inhibitor 28Dc-like [Topomyia yanbarensis]